MRSVVQEFSSTDGPEYCSEYRATIPVLLLLFTTKPQPAPARFNRIIR
jgi:hypothetical protein